MALVIQRIKVITGIVLLIVGSIGTLLPVIPGVPIILAGFALMGTDHPIVRRLKARFKSWHKRRTML